MVKKIIWSHNARIKLFAILEFYAKRNGNKKYSAKLYKRFNKQIKLLIRNPQLGIQSSKDNIRGLIILDYIIFMKAMIFKSSFIPSGPPIKTPTI